MSKKDKLYRLSFLIAQKADIDGKTKEEITEELILELGVTKQRFYKIKNWKADKPSRLSTQQLLALAQYFDCAIDDLVNRSLQPTSLAPGASMPDTEADSVVMPGEFSSKT